MTQATRRQLIAATAGIVGSGLATGAAHAAEAQPAELFGSVRDGVVSLPSIHAPSEGPETLANPEPPGKRLGVAVVGVGRLALEQILPGFAQAKSVRLTALVSGRREKALAVASQYGVSEKNVYDYANFDSIKNNPDVDIVYIVLPNSMHAEYTVRAAQAGKHVLCEKPMATNVADAQRMVDACKQAGRKLMIAYRLQYNVAHRQVIDIARKKTFGDMRLIEAVNTQNDAAPGQWRQIKALAGGGSLPDVGLYCLSAFRYITGEEPVEITGRLTQPKDDPRFKEVEDIANFTLLFPSGVMAIGTSGYSMHDSRTLRVMAANGWFGLDPAFGYDNLALAISHHVEGANAFEQRRFSPKNQFAVEMDHFADAIRADVEPHTPGAEGLQDQKIIAAIYEAAAGGGVVKFPAGPRLDFTRGPAPKSDG